jgi:hypothetical protein
MPATDVTPESVLALELYHAEQSLLDSAMFRAVVANPTSEYAALKTWADDPTKGGDVTFGRSDAAAVVAWYEVDEEENPEDVQSTETRVILRHGEEGGRHLGGLQVRQGGLLLCLLELQVPTAYTATRTQSQKKNLYRWGLNIIGRIMREMMAARDTASRLTIDAIDIDPSQVGTYDRDDENGADVFFAMFRIAHQGP